MMQAWLIVPALAVGYLLTAPIAVRARLKHTVVAGAVLLGVSLSWVGLMTLTPEDSRPYADGSTNNSAAAMVFGYNGLGRLGVDLPGAVAGQAPGGAGGTAPVAEAPGARAPGAPPAAGSPPAGRGTAPTGTATARSGADRGDGWTKLVGDRFATQIAWLFPIALLSLAHGLTRRRRPGGYVDQARGGYLVWGVWLLTSAVVLSAIGVPHTGYAAVLAAPLAALSAAGPWPCGDRDADCRRPSPSPSRPPGAAGSPPTTATGRRG